MGLLCSNCKYERPSNHRGADTSCPLCNTAYPTKSKFSLAKKCGAAFGAMGRLQKWLAVIVAIAVLVILAGGLSAYYMNQKSANAEKKIREAVTDFLLSAVKEHLKDPDSVQFRGLEYFADKMAFEDGSRYTLQHKLCGEINAKNSYGGYVGYRSFYATAIFNPTTGDLNREAMTVWIEDTTMSKELQESQAKRKKDECVNTVTNANSVAQK